MFTQSHPKEGIVFGAGSVGGFVARHLHADGYHVTAVDNDPGVLKRLSDTYGVHTQRADISDAQVIRELAANKDFAVDTSPGHIGYHLSRTLIEAGVPYIVGTAFFADDERKFHDAAVEHGATFAPHRGIGPGIGEALAAYEYYINEFVIRDLSYQSAGLAVDRKKIPYHRALFAPRDTLDLYLRPAEYVENGVLKHDEKPFSGKRNINIQGLGKFVGVRTSGLRGIVELPGLVNAEELTLREPDHYRLMQEMYEMGYFSDDTIMINGQPVIPRLLADQLIFGDWRKPYGDDNTIVKLDLVGEQRGKKKKQVNYLMVDGNKHGFTSMARTTGAVALASLRGMFKGFYEKPGVYTPTDDGKIPGLLPFMLADMYAQFGIQYERSES